MSKQWKIVDHPSIPGMIVIEGPAFRLVICAQATNITSSDYLQIMADARLIAAAPEMYELMCAAVRFLQTASQYHPLTVTEEKWEQKALELMAQIEGGGE